MPYQHFREGEREEMAEHEMLADQAGHPRLMFKA